VPKDIGLRSAWPISILPFLIHCISIFLRQTEKYYTEFRKIATQKRMRFAIKLLKNSHLPRISRDYPPPL